jgi:hypothetical protein
VAGLHGPVAARMEASEAVGLIIESLSSLSLQEDRLVALVEAGQVRGLTNCVKLYVGLLFYIVTSVHVRGGWPHH